MGERKAIREDTRKQDRLSFFNMYTHSFIRVAACIPGIRVSDPRFNVEKTIELVQEAYSRKAVIAVFPELGLSGYSNDDLFFQESLLHAVQEGLKTLLRETAHIDMVIVVGAPIVAVNALFNCALIMHEGKILGIAVKSYLPNYREYYEARYFKSARDLFCNSIDLAGQSAIPIGPDLLFQGENIPHFRFFVEICEDLWAPIPPSSYAALSGATVLANLSASNITMGKDDYRRELASNQSARCVSAYVYSACGPGESTTDLAWDGHGIIAENGTLLSESSRFSWSPQVITADIDLERLVQDRMRFTTFCHATRSHADLCGAFRTVPVKVSMPGGRILPEREIPRFPYVPHDPAIREKRCFEIYNIQVQGLVKRMESAGIKNLVIGVSGGLDSTHALIVCARAMDALGLPRSNIKAYTLPGYATSKKTYANATALMHALGVEAGEIDIRPSCDQMLKDIGHPCAQGSDDFDLTFENVQAGARTSILFRLANFRQAMVVGTGDLSELALGWCTYGVGDHMSHYNVNVSIPKTLIQYIVRWVAREHGISPEVSSCLEEILDTEISPELIPGTNGDQPSQSTEAIIGPYELQDFNTFYITRYGYRPSKVAFLSWCAWRDAAQGTWPDVPGGKRHQYTLGEIKHWLEIFIHRFFKLSQYKRSCIPNGPKVGSGGSLSPRGDYRAPSDSEDTPWMEDLAMIPDADT
ncbi:MAG TPA: NAD(+) synthase [Deltaproteobacteria bacterium]|nr:NAD(+) synthase [Deltaproteobacteria bacterium]